MSASPYSLRNRRSYAIMERLAQMNGTQLVTLGNFDSPPRRMTEKERATALAEAGEHALMLAIGTAARKSRLKQRAVWRAMRPESGARASVFFAHGLAEITRRLASSPGHHLNPERQARARARLREAFPWSDDQERLLDDATDPIDPATAEGELEAFIEVAYHAVREAAGEKKAGRLPEFERVGGFDPEAYYAQLAWQICRNQVMSAWLQVSDSSGLAVWRSQLRDAERELAGP